MTKVLWSVPKSHDLIARDNGTFSLGFDFFAFAYTNSIDTGEFDDKAFFIVRAVNPENGLASEWNN